MSGGKGSYGLLKYDVLVPGVAAKAQWVKSIAKSPKTIL
jgi:hypothetical protein